MGNQLSFTERNCNFCNLLYGSVVIYSYLHVQRRHLKLLCYRISSAIRVYFFLPKNPKNLAPSYKTNLNLWDCLGRVKTRIIAKFYKTVSVICSLSRQGKTLSYCSIQISKYSTKDLEYLPCKIK